MVKVILLVVFGIASLLAVRQVRAKVNLTPELNALIISKAKEWKLNPALIKAHARVESGFDVNAKNPADPSYGLMQITPMLASDYGLIVNWRSPSKSEIERIYNVKNNLNVACWFIRNLRIKHTMEEAIQMYNVGEAGYRKGVRNLTYLKTVRKYYEQYN